jgi:hypothetical protein
MKRITALLVLTAALVSMGSFRANAQAVEFKVPFDFTIQNRALPAGTYQVSYAATNSILIRSLDGRFHVLTLTYAADGSPSGDGKLIFTKYGNQYFLHDVLCSNLDMNVEIPTSRQEKQARIQQALLPRSETVAALRVGAK